MTVPTRPVLLTVLVAAGGCAPQGPRPDTEQPPATRQSIRACAPNCETVGEQEWPRYEGEGFSLRYPPAADVSQEGPGLTRFRMLGPDAKAATEITDGFTFTIGHPALPDGTSASSFAREVLRQAREIGEVLEPIRRVDFHGRSALRLRTRTVADSTHLVVARDSGRVLHVVWSVADPGGRGYRQRIDAMLRTLELDRRQQAGATTEVALLDPEQRREGPTRGCDAVVFVERPRVAAPTAAESALRTLFALDQVRVDGLYNFIAKTRDTLHVDGVEILDGTARVRLTGALSGLSGVCDDPRARIQIQETLKRLPAVDDVEILLDGRPTDLRPDARGR